MRPACPARSRSVASLALAGLLVSCTEGAAGAPVGPARGPFPPLTEATARSGGSIVTPESVRGPSYTRAYVALGAGVALTLGSFLLAESADRAYESYLEETDTAAIEEAYDDAGRLDNLAAAALIAGNAALVLGLYWRFIQRPKSDANLQRSLGTEAGASFEPPVEHGLAPRIVPDITPRHVGLAVTIALP